MYKEIKNLILNKKNNIEEKTLQYYCNYFNVIVSLDLIPNDITLEELIDNVLRIDKIKFFKDDDPIVKQYGDNFKGKRDTKSKTLYVRNSLPEDIKEITTYHEIHHAAQTSEEMIESEACGINKEGNLGRLIMEAQTQWVAEEVYKKVHDISFEERLIPSESLRMKPGQTICSSLHNYEMYDGLLSKLAIIMGVPKEYFVKINFMYKNNEGIKKLQGDYEKAIKEKNIPISFDTMMKTFDYAYIVDLICYIKHEEANTILNGESTLKEYLIHNNWQNKLSQHNQAGYIRDFDNKVILALMNTANNPKSDFVKYSKYIFDNKNRKIVEDYIKNNIEKSTSISEKTMQK